MKLYRKQSPSSAPVAEVWQCSLNLKRINEQIRRISEKFLKISADKQGFS